ncbi:MAG: MoaD/ThiS family protein [Chloroflexi bacterium]|nr:MoaD/ThiS family protein [Chloroflexota bacterium]
MTRHVVEMFGLCGRIAGQKEAEIELKESATLGDVVAALRRQVPALEGEVIRPEENRLTDRYAFNINGHSYFDNRKLPLQDGDHIILLTLSAGG